MEFMPTTHQSKMCRITEGFFLKLVAFDGGYEWKMARDKWLNMYVVENSEKKGFLGVSSKFS